MTAALTALFVGVPFAGAVDTGGGGDTGGCHSRWVLDIEPSVCWGGEVVAIRPRVCDGGLFPAGTTWTVSWRDPETTETIEDPRTSPTDWTCPYVEIGRRGRQVELWVQVYDADGVSRGSFLGEVEVFGLPYGMAPADVEPTSERGGCASAGGATPPGATLPGALLPASLALAWATFVFGAPGRK